MDDPRLVALGLVPPPPGQQETEDSAATPAAPPATPDWQPAQQSQYLPPPTPFSAAASSIPEYPDPFTAPPAAPVSQRPAPPPQPAAPSIFSSPNSPFAFAPQAQVAAPAEPPTTSASPAAPVAPPNPFSSPNSPFSMAPSTFAPSAPPIASPAAAPLSKKDQKRLAEEAKKAAQLAEENAVKAAKVAEKDAKEAAKLAAVQAKIDAKNAAEQAKIDARNAQIAEREAKRAAKRGKPDQVMAAIATPQPTFAPPTSAPQPFTAAAPQPFTPTAPTPKPFVPPAILAPTPKLKRPDLELMATITKHPAAIRKDVRFGLVGRARLELAPLGVALVGLRGGTAYTWNEVKEVGSKRGRLEIKTEADREKLVKTKEGTTVQPYVEKLTRSLMVSIDGAAEPGLAPYVARVMQDMKAQTFNYHATSWLEYENALERVRGEFSEHDDPFVPAVAGALFAFIFFAGLFILPEIVNLASDIRPPVNSGAFVIQPRYSWLDLRSFVMAVGLSALATRLVLRLGLGSSALAWARGSTRGWHTSGPRILRILTRELARLLLATTATTAMLLLGFAAFAPTVASTLVIDTVGLREVVPLPIVGIDKKWSEVTDVQKSDGPGRLEGFGVTIIFSGGRWVSTIDHDLSGGTDGQLLKAADSLWKNATR